MEEAIASEAEGDAAEASLLDMQEQLDDLEFDGELAELPIGVVIASICRTLGLEFDLKQFTDAELGLTPGSVRLAATVAEVKAGADFSDDPGVLPIWPPRAGMADPLLD